MARGLFEKERDGEQTLKTQAAGKFQAEASRVKQMRGHHDESRSRAAEQGE